MTPMSVCGQKPRKAVKPGGAAVEEQFVAAERAMFPPQADALFTLDGCSRYLDGLQRVGQRGGVRVQLGIEVAQ